MTMYTLSKIRLLVICGVLISAGLIAGCDGDNSKITTGGDKSPKPDATATADTPAPDSNETPEPDVVERTDVAKLPGLMDGAWVLTENTDDAVISYFNLTHFEGEPSVTGDFLTGPGLYDGLFEGGPGDLVDSSFSATTLTLKWNPTTQETEQFTLSASKVDDDTFTGKVTAVENTGLNLDVTLARDTETPGE